MMLEGTSAVGRRPFGPVRCWRRTGSIVGALTLALGLVGLVAAPVSAQAPQKGPAAPKAGARTAAKSKDEGGSNEQRLQRRVEHLEEQLVDMQVLIGTLESLARSGGGGGGSGGGAAAPVARGPAAAAGGAYSSSDAARIDTMEMQIRALSAQIEQMSNQMRAVDGRRGDAGASVAPAGAALPPAHAERGAGSPPVAARFGATTVTPRGGDAIGSLIANNEQVAPPGPVVRDTLPPAIAGGDGATPKQLYETAYGYLLQPDYGAAEAAFTAFLKRYPNDQLASNAQYWLGESFFVRGQYKEAASAFLAGVQTYGRGAKAADSMLKLAMSLDRLGQREAACSSYTELSSRFPNAPSHVRNRANAERQRIRCG